jgi:2-oxoglutarate ferredoxin oxidoreductase subunit alpha
MDFSLLIGGSAGQGIDTFAAILERYLHTMGFFVFSNRDYMSRIRGGHNFIQIRFSDRKLWSHPENHNLIIGLDKTTQELHKERLTDDGIVISEYAEGKVISLPLSEKAKEGGNPKGASSIALGITLKLFSIDKKGIVPILKDFFEGDSLDSNVKCIDLGYELVEEKFKAVLPSKGDKMLINGNQSIALGALAGGCKFYSAYPMTPSTSILTYLAAKQSTMEIVVEQAEDEIAAINMALGASYAGVRAMTGTSGGGFSLMVEGVGLAGITETPIVIANVQRPGPATGLPTRTEQGDLKFVINASQGEFPRMVIALRYPEDCFYQTVRAFNIAEKYQIPVIILSDQYLADYNQSTEPYDLNKIQRESFILKDWKESEPYKRYQDTPSGISPLLCPGKAPGNVVKIDSDEHDEWGHIIEGAHERRIMVEKRDRKLDGIIEKLIEPEFLGSKDAELLVLAWGSTYGPLKEAVEILQSSGIKIGALVFGDIWPLPVEKLMEHEGKAQKIINIEGNSIGQLADIVREVSGVTCDYSILKYDGRPFSAHEIVERIKGEVL